MKVILAVVMSADGMLTDAKGRPPSAWASAEDQKLFRSLVRKSGVVIIGRHTYEAQKEAFRAPKSKALRIVMTSSSISLKKETIPGQLEFTSLSPRVLIQKLKDEGYKQVLLAGGPKLIYAFLKTKLVDELWLTIEPVLFGAGMDMAADIPMKVPLKLIETKKLNERGTILYKCKVQY